MRDVVVYTTIPCGFCTRVNMQLQARGIAFREVNIHNDPDAILELARRSGLMTLPQVFVDGALIGGYRETAEADASGRLQQLLAA
jgi:glutaredoxin 3